MGGGLRIGDVARLAGTTPRTIRYYEEIGLLPASGARERGAHRTYAEEDVERLTDLLRLKDLLGLSLEELKALVEAEDARACHIGRQLDLVRHRRDEIATLESELLAKRKRVQTRLRELTPNSSRQEGR
jgi:DNA-binding transcriptional MerR regulator